MQTIARLFLFVGLLVAVAVPVELADPVTCRNPGEYIPDPVDCTAYYICDDNNNPQYYHCNNGLYYDEYTHGCNYPQNVPCSGGVRPPYTGGPSTAYTGTAPDGVNCLYVGQYIPDPYSCTGYWYCGAGLIPSPSTCQNGLEFDVYTDTCNYPEYVDCTDGVRPPRTTSTKAPPTTTTTYHTLTPPSYIYCDGSQEYIPDPYDCAIYWQCDDANHAHNFTCPSGTVWNTVTNQCDYPRNVACVGGVRPSASTIQCDYGGQTYSDDLTCSGYYVCENRDGSGLQPYHYFCPNGLYFNPATITCDYPANVDCDQGVRPTGVPTVTAGTNTPNGGIICTYPGQKIADPADCTAFWICDSNDNAQYYHCGTGLYYNPTAQNCDLDNGNCKTTQPITTVKVTTGPPCNPNIPNCTTNQVGLSYPNNCCCNFYYYCNATSFVTTVPCPAGTDYNPATTLCDYPANVNCQGAPEC